MKKIELKRRDLLSTQRFVLVDDEDYLEMCKYSWSVHDSVMTSRSHTYYARSTIKGKTVYMHRMLLPNDDSKMMVDHINGDGLDNQRQNLRLVSKSFSNHNTRIRFDNKSGYRGVCFRSDRKRWRANFQGQHLGYFMTAEEAAKAYNKEAIAHFGKDAVLNEV